MEKYIGTKIVYSQPITFNDFQQKKYGDQAHMIKPEDELGYMVVYEDGYTSWSPRSAFEAAYRRTNGMNFGLAIEALKKGYIVRRKGWNGKGIFIELQVPDKNSKMTHPYIYIDTTGLQTDNPDAPKNRVPWIASQTDMLADDWEIV